MMTTKRFKELATMYGADLKRWPEAEREAAIQFTNSNELGSTLLNEALLDDLLANYSVETNHHKLANLIFTDAINIHTAPNDQLPWWKTLANLWNEVNLSGYGVAGLVSASLASALAGVFCVSLLTSNILSKNPVSASINAETLDYGQDWR